MFTLTAQDRHGVMIQRSQSGTREKEVSGTLRAGASTTDMTVMIAQCGRGFNEGGLHEIAPTVSNHSYEHNNHVVTMYDGYNGKEIGNEKIGTLTTNAGFDGRNGFKVVTETRIRRLTPLETWRLMGRDDWEHEAAKVAGISDSQRYKQAGNSLVPVIVESIAQRINKIVT
jgi:DNA (cytosine-5)-methyltransferase 1